MKSKKCLVPICKNNNILNPEKLFILVPRNVQTRKQWFQAIFGADTDVPKTRYVHVCEDHFNMQHDAVNFMEYKLIGRALFMKKETVPHKNMKELRNIEDEHFSSSAKKRKQENLTSSESRKKLDCNESEPSTSFFRPIKPKINSITSSSCSFEVFERPSLPPGITASLASSSSIFPLSTSSFEEIVEFVDHMRIQKSKVTILNKTVDFFLGLLQEEYF